jgi:hypothetical protein
MPMVDRNRGLLVEPEIPFEPLSIVNLAAPRGATVTLSTVEGESINTKLDRNALISFGADVRG